jgi:hypothetical protein
MKAPTGLGTRGKHVKIGQKRAVIAVHLSEEE